MTTTPLCSLNVFFTDKTFFLNFRFVYPEYILTYIHTYIHIRHASTDQFIKIRSLFCQIIMLAIDLKLSAKLKNPSRKRILLQVRPQKSCLDAPWQALTGKKVN
jgi:hypothetical protein